MDNKTLESLSAAAGWGLLAFVGGIVLMVIAVLAAIFWRCWIEQAMQRKPQADPPSASAFPLICRSCRKVMPAADEEIMRALQASIEALPYRAAPPILVCFDCYHTLMGESPGDAARYDPIGPYTIPKDPT